MRPYTHNCFLFYGSIFKICHKQRGCFSFSGERVISFIFFVFFALSVSLSPVIAGDSSDFNKNLFKHIKWRQIGPANFGGRIDDIEAVPDNPKIIFIAAASGGIFKTQQVDIIQVMRHCPLGEEKLA